MAERKVFKILDASHHFDNKHTRKPLCKALKRFLSTTRDQSHTDIHSHARTHVRDSMHCFWKFWSHNTSIFSSTSCNWQPCLVPHGITQDHLKWEGEERKRKKSYVMVFKCIRSQGGAVFEKVYFYLKACSKWNQTVQSWTINNKAQLQQESVHIHPSYCIIKEEIDSWAAG